MISLKIVIALSLLVATLATEVFSQEYLDNDKRYMKLTEVSTDKTYGFEVTNAIKVGSDERAIGAYLNSLKPLDGDRLHLGDLKQTYKGQVGLTMVVLTYEQKKVRTTLYFLSTQYEQPKAIVGYAFKTVDDLPKVIVYPTDSIIKVTACSQTMYSVDDFILKGAIGDFVKPTTNPIYTGGLDELRKHFSANPLTDTNAKQSIFRVSIAFVVTCDGKAGNLMLLTKGRGYLATYANQVLAIVNRMPQKWRPATVDGKQVDCYQVLNFIPTAGQLDNVSYR